MELAAESFRRLEGRRAEQQALENFPYTTTMEAPYTIASLPKPLDAETGSIYAAPVFSYRGLKKRKRHEVVVGVDGESVNIYNVRMRYTLI